MSSMVRGIEETGTAVSDAGGIARDRYLCPE